MMNTDRRREVRNARRLRRHQRGGVDGNGATDAVSGSAAVGGRSLSPRLDAAQNTTQDSGTTARVAGGRRLATITTRNEAQRLSERMQQQRQVKRRADQMLSEREAHIREQYAPNAIVGIHDGQPQQEPVSAHHFNQNDLLASLIGESKANFLKLDHDLTEEHTIATHRLHSSVFAHANDFLLLFRDVDRSSDLVEALKANVQGTKAAISSISKYTSANIVVSGGASSTDKLPGAAGVRGGGTECGSVFSSALGGAAGDGDPRRFARPSLISRRTTQRYASGGSNDMSWMSGGDARFGGVTGGVANMGSSAVSSSSGIRTQVSAMQRSGVAFKEEGVTGGGADAIPTNANASHPTTRGLNVFSVRQWRHIIGMRSSPGAGESFGDRAAAETRPAAPRRRLQTGGGVPGGPSAPAETRTAAARFEKEATDTAAFVDILREEVSQLLTERRHVDAAELLCRLADEAKARGCLPFLLDLEAALVSSVVTNVVRIPVTPMYVESLHIPLIQLLLRFGRSRSAAVVYLAMHTSWLHREVQRLQSCVNPQYASLIAVDFLVRAIRTTVQRQHTLGLSLAAARPLMGDGHAGAFHAVSEGKTDVKKTAYGVKYPAATAAAADVTRTKSASPASATAASQASLIPPNSAALLWVRCNVERFACDVLATHLLSFGTGTDGGDPTRIRQAAQMIAQTSRVMQTLSKDGFAGCDTLIMRHLTPSLVILEDDFTRLTGERAEHGGRAMVEQLIMGSLAFYEASLSNNGALAAGPPAATSASAVKDAGSNGSPATPRALPAPIAVLSAPQRSTPPYQPSRCDDVARKARACCQDLVQLIRSLPLSGHSLLIQLLLAPASSSLFKNASWAGTSAVQGLPSPVPLPRPAMHHSGPSSVEEDGAIVHRTIGGSGATPVYRKPGASSALPTVAPNGALSFTTASPPPLSPERFRFLRYANGCSSTHVRLLQSLCGYVAALTGADQLPTEVMASASVQERESSKPAAATAMRVQQAECVAYLLTNAMVAESVDVVVCNLISRMILVLLHQRKSLVRFLSSEEFLTNHRRVFPFASTNPLLSDVPLLCDPSTSPAWVLDSTLCLLSDVLGLGVWVSFFTRGGAMAHMLADAQFDFRTQHLERVQREMPRLVQGWMCATLMLSADVTRAQAVLAPSTASAPVFSTTTPLATPQQSILFGLQPLDGGDDRPAAAGQRSKVSSSPVAAEAGMKTSKTNTNTGSVLLSIPVTSPSLAPLPSAVAADKRYAVTTLFAGAGVREERMMKIILMFLDRKYCTPANYTVHQYVVDSAKASFDGGASAGAGGVWALRGQLSSYPKFPIGEIREHRSDEGFFFHWCVQISLHLLTFFQERLITPSYVMNQHATEAAGGGESFLKAGCPFPLKGCISPQEDTLLAAWCAGGGNYVTAVAVLQFLVMRLLRDGLCRIDTWSAVYGCPVAQWRGDEAVLRQQLFFFSLFAYLWAPLFTGGRSSRARPAALGRTASVSSPPSKEEAPVSSFLLDGLSSLTVLEWMTCGGVLSSSTGAGSVSTATASATLTAIPANLTAIPANLTAVDVLFGTEGPIHMTSGRGEGANADSGVTPQPAVGGRGASWRNKAGEGGSVDASSPTVGTAAPPATSTNAMLAKRELFGSHASWIPDGPLRVLRHFFEVQLSESRAAPALTSEAMRTRVERAMTGINLFEFVGTSFGTDEEESEDDSSSTMSRSSGGTGSVNGGTPASRLTLQNLRDLIAVYTLPLS